MSKPTPDQLSALRTVRDQSGAVSIDTLNQLFRLGFVAIDTAGRVVVSFKGLRAMTSLVDWPRPRDVRPGTRWRRLADEAQVEAVTAPRRVSGGYVVDVRYLESDCAGHTYPVALETLRPLGKEARR